MDLKNRRCLEGKVLFGINLFRKGLPFQSLFENVCYTRIQQLLIKNIDCERSNNYEIFTRRIKRKFGVSQAYGI